MHVTRQPEDATLPAGVPEVGSVIAGKYQIEGVLGAGGMGVVVAARHAQLGQRVAIKFMTADGTKDANAVQRFLREARASVALSSEHVARVTDVGTLEDGAPYMVMEFLSGLDLGQLLRRDGPMTVASAVGTVLQACEAIAEAHAMDIVHRDLKPANLFVTSRMDGSPLVKVLDFGISKAMQFAGTTNAASLTASGLVMGSPAYMSPEQVRSAKDVDRRSDIWSIGVILYELLTGSSPFAGETLGDTFAKIASESPKPIREHRPDVPQRLASVIDQCLERKLDARVQSVAELASKLLPFAPKEAHVSVERVMRLSAPSHARAELRSETLLAPEGMVQAPWATESPWLRSQRGSTRPIRVWPRVAVGAGLAVLVAAGVGTTLYARRLPPPQASAAPNATPNAANGSVSAASVSAASAALAPREPIETGRVETLPAAVPVVSAPSTPDIHNAPRPTRPSRPRATGPLGPALAPQISRGPTQGTSSPASSAPPGDADPFSLLHPM